MYNRYIPQPDGSYRRNRCQEPKNPALPPRPATQKKPEPPKEPACPPPEKPPREEKHPPQKQPPCRQDMGAMSFLRQLLPKDFDTGDLFIVLLLLLMAGDCDEDKNTALLTLALYFLM